MTIKSFQNRNKRRDKKISKKKHGMRVDSAAREFALRLRDKSELKSNPVESMFHR